MAKPPELTLDFSGKCPDCGNRQVGLPFALPDIGDDFEWTSRDYDGLRLTMLEELAARFPERRRWTTADLEVVLVEVLAAVLDQLSDQIDRVTTEAFLETARRPASVRRLLSMIGYDAVLHSYDEIGAKAEDNVAETERKLDAYWLKNPHLMDRARQAGPRLIHEQNRMVSTSDYSERLEDHPLVERAHAWVEWGGSWNIVRVAVICWRKNVCLDQVTEKSEDGILGELVYPEDLIEEVENLHQERELFLPSWNPVPSTRTILRHYLDRYRMLGQEVILEDAIPVSISISFSIVVASNFFQSEVRHAVEDALSSKSGGFFEPGRLRFGEDVHVSDLYQTLMALDGVENVCLNRFKRIGSQYPDQVQSGVIVLEGLEVAVCDNDSTNPGRGYWWLVLHGGKRG